MKCERCGKEGIVEQEIVLTHLGGISGHWLCQTCREELKEFISDAGLKMAATLHTMKGGRHD